MPAGNARMLRLMVSSSALFACSAQRALWACWNPLTRFWVPLVHHRHGVELGGFNRCSQQFWTARADRS